MPVNPGVAKALAVSVRTQMQNVINLIDAGDYKAAQNAALNAADEYEKLKAELED